MFQIAGAALAAPRPVDGPQGRQGVDQPGEGRQLPHQVEPARHEDCLQGGEDAGCDDRRDRVRGIVEAVDEFETDAENDHQREQDGGVVQLAVLHHDRFDDVGDILAAVDRNLDQ